MSRPIPIVFVSGLPRSGSTLLMQVLGQNPAHHVTATNDLVDLVRTVRNRWTHCRGFQSQGLQTVQPRVHHAIQGMMTGFYASELMAGRVVFDKSRGWPGMLEVVEQSFGQRARVIITLRDVRGVLASFEKIHRRDMMTKFGNWAPTTEGRARDLLSDKAVVGASVNMIRDALRRGYRDRMVIVPFSDLCTRPEETLQRLHTRLGLPSFDYDFEHVEQVTHEDDSVHGMRLHQIRTGPIQPPAPAPWRQMFVPRFNAWAEAEYGDITRLMQSTSLPPRHRAAPAPAPERTSPVQLEVVDETPDGKASEVA